MPPQGLRIQEFQGTLQGVPVSRIGNFGWRNTWFFGDAVYRFHGLIFWDCWHDQYLANLQGLSRHPGKEEFVCVEERKRGRE